MPYHPAEVFNHVINLGNNQWQVYILRQGFHCFQAVLVLSVGVNIGVIPEGADLVSLLPPVFNGVGGAVGAAAVNKNRLHFTIYLPHPLCPPLLQRRGGRKVKRGYAPLKHPSDKSLYNRVGCGGFSLL